MVNHITVREFINALSKLNQETLIVMTSEESDCSHAFCDNAVVSPTIKRRTNQQGERYLLAPASRLGNSYGPLLEEKEEREE